MASARDRRRDGHRRVRLQVLGLEVVEPGVPADQHLGRDAGVRRPAGRALENGALDLHARHRRLHEHLRIVLAGDLDRLLQPGRIGHLGRADAGPAPGRLDEDRPAELGDVVEHPLALGRDRGPRRAAPGFRLAPVTVADDHVAPDGQAARGEDQLHVLLVHAGRAGEHPGPRVPGARHLQQALDRAVLAVRAVQQRQHDVNLAEAARGVARGRDHQAARGRVEAGGDLGAGGGHGLHGRQLAAGDGQPPGVVGGKDPAAVAGDAHRHDLIPVAVERREHVPGAEARYRVFRAPPAEHDRHPDLASGVQCCSPLGA